MLFKSTVTNALSPAARKRGAAKLATTGDATCISFSALPNLSLVAANAIKRTVPSKPGIFNSIVALPSALNATAPLNNDTIFKSGRAYAPPLLLIPSPPKRWRNIAPSTLSMILP